MIHSVSTAPTFDMWSIGWMVFSNLWPYLVLLALLVFAREYLELRTARIRRAAEPAPIPLETKMQRLAEITGEAGRLNVEVQAEIILAQSETLKLKSAAEEAEKIAALNADQREAVASLVSSQMNRALDVSGRSDRRLQLLINIGFFIAGILVTLFVPPLWQ